MKKFKIKSFCKINLSLRVSKKLNKSYHNINSLITFCDLHDVISISKIEGINDKIIFSGKFKYGVDKKLNTITKSSIKNKRLGLYKYQKSNFYKLSFIFESIFTAPHGS